ncbi:MAG: amidohydrolase family protein [Gammaproteobacteria bacterium]|nr:amidohydrolase family protein [Gammaproteobacteria bacterium]
MTSTTFSNVRIWNGISGEYSEYDSVSIADGKISALGERNAHSRTMDGLTIIPGLIDAHVHMTLDPKIPSLKEQLSQSDDEIRAKMRVRAQEMVRSGITTARDLGGGRWLELELRDRINRGEVAGPRLLCAGQPLTSKNGHCYFWGGEATNKSEISEVVDRQHAHGVDLIKIMATGGMYTKNSQPGRAQFEQEEVSLAVEIANRLGYSVAAHCHGTEGIAHAAFAGVATIEHCSWLDTQGSRAGCDKDISREIARRGIWVSPTINAGWARFMGGDGRFEAHIKKLFKDMKECGVKFIASTDAGIPNVLHHELSRALQVFASLAGLSPVESLLSATTHAANALGIKESTGTIEVGKDADLLFLEGDPLQDLAALQQPVLVVARGREYSTRS